MRILAFLPLLLTLPAMAAEPSASMNSSGMGTQMTKLLFGLLLVIGLIFLLAWLLRRMQQLNPRGNQAIKLISSHALGPRERLVLVQVGSEQVLLGLSAGRITPLHVLEEPVHLPDAEPANPEFAQRLMELLGRDQKDKP
ncbi:flagellar biosynthetic protein FliO [Stutzerimonas sp. VN223-3]|uniref:flagellar biosynthetic protein FliO n=1 Tax=Stutzerimonas TaxID=2901164 RepID=UPI00210E8F66|nr:flagellar biosynthetic protein FliO [Stutzerimonas stutzeri]MCQ4312668.1 flagellar biosynthetic protein FliO [Stutzerimonas stutzeri]